jgi:hypothetical protein
MASIRQIEQAVNTVYLQHSKEYPVGGIRAFRPEYSKGAKEHSLFSAFFIILCWHYEYDDVLIKQKVQYTRLLTIVKVAMDDLNQEPETVQIFKQVQLHLQLLK